MVEGSFSFPLMMLKPFIFISWRAAINQLERKGGIDTLSTVRFIMRLNTRIRHRTWFAKTHGVTG